MNKEKMNSMELDRKTSELTRQREGEAQTHVEKKPKISPQTEL
jgi:hypothetical protein